MLENQFYSARFEYNSGCGKKRERGVVVGCQLPGLSYSELLENLKELILLCDTAGIEVVGLFKQRREAPDPATFIGKGKLMEIIQFAKSNNVDIIVFDDELTPAQIHNIEKMSGIRVIERTGLIIEIFARRARSYTARLQVELAKYQYLLPRLRHMWSHLHRQAGGIGTRGPGEKEIETDRRAIKKRIQTLKKKLEKVARVKETQRKGRSNLIKCAIVGYTNAGKSTLFNVLTHGGSYVEDKLFATLDTKVDRTIIGGIPMVFIDTIGFIRKLPPHLVASFHATLDDINDADLLLHVIDVSSPYFKNYYSTVKKTLHEIGIEKKPTILVLNKIDAVRKNKSEHFDYTGEESYSLDAILSYFRDEMHEEFVVPVSCMTGENINYLKEVIKKVIWGMVQEGNFFGFVEK